MDNLNDHHDYCQGDFDPEDIVITGVAGRFPDCRTVKELLEGLMEKKNLITFSDERHGKGALKLPFSSPGTIPDLDKFDAEFFSIPISTANNLDPGTRTTLEVSYEAVADSGFEVNCLKSANIGVYNATTSDDAQLLSINKIFKQTGFSWLRCLSANRVSYSFDFVGPSLSLDTACSSSAVCVWAAVKDLLDDRVEAAVVNSSQINLSPAVTNAYFKHGVCSHMGTNSLPFDANTGGMIRTEAITAIFIQKAKHARRVYAKICTSRFVSSGYVPEGLSVPSMPTQIKITQGTLKDEGLKPDDINYIECHGTGTVIGDPIELNAMATVFLRDGNRKKPLHVGTIKSNIGHTEASAGLCGIIKASMALDTGIIPPNYKFSTPNPRCKELVEGKLKVVTEPLPVQSPYIIVNSYGIAGTISQVLLKQNPKDFNNSPAVKSELPKFVLYPGTCESAVKFLFDYVKDNPELPYEFFALLHKLSFCPPLHKPFRGYACFEDHKNLFSEIQVCPSNKRQVWFVFTGMGCQWKGMGLQLMELEPFANALTRCAEVLEPLGMDLFDILKPDNDIIEQDRLINNAMCGIAAIQIAMTDLLKALDIQPDGIVGHSTGEVMGAYADGCTTLEETILSVYWRGASIEEKMKERGAMAAIGLTWAEAVERCPKNVYASCHNADDSVTISGLEADVEKFVAQLKKENIFAKVVNAYGYCFHCKYTEPAAPMLKEKLLQVIKHPKPRTSRWVSSSYPEQDWHFEPSKYAGAEYFTHNLISPVLFNEATKKIPSDAITIEIGPHFLLKSIMKRSLGPDSTNLGLMKRNETNNLQYFFQQIGKLYNEGLNPKIENLYPPVKFPVPRGVPRISDLIRWNHSVSFEVPKWTPEGGDPIYFELDREDSYLMDHFIDGRSLFPATGYIFIAWDMFATKNLKSLNEMPIMVENFKIHRATVITQKSNLTFNFTLLSSCGHFEITDGHDLVASGQISEWKNVQFSEPEPVYQSSDSAVAGPEIYNELKMAGYEYKSAFQMLQEVNMDGTQGLIQWQDRWISFLDAHLLFFGLIHNSSDFQLPTGALSFKIDPRVLLKQVEESDDPSNQSIPVNFNASTNTCRSVGIEITNLETDPAPHRIKDTQPNLEEFRFIPYLCSYIPDKDLELYFLRYMWACNLILDTIGEKLKTEMRSHKFSVGKDSGITFNDYLETLTENHCLFKCLQEVAQSPADIKNRKTDSNTHFPKCLGKDILNTIMTTDYPLRILIEIITENNFRKLNFLEINKCGFKLVLPSIIDILKRFTHLRVKSSVVVTGSEVEVNNEELSEFGIQHKFMDSMESFAEVKEQDVVIGSYMGGSQNELRETVKTLNSALKPGGFIMFYCKEILTPAEQFLLNYYGINIEIQSRTVAEIVFHENNLVIISKIFDSFSTAVYLLRSSVAATSPKIFKITDDNQFKWIENIKQFLSTNETDNLWLVAEDTPQNGIIGMVNCLKQEPGGERVRCVFIDINEGESKPPAFNLELPFYKSLLKRDLIMNVWHGGNWGSFRHVSLNNQKELKMVEHSYVNCRKFGDLSSFEWLESHVKYASRQNEKLVHIYYSALNFKDVMLATGKLNIGTTKSITGQADNSVLGLEFSGRDESGKRVTGILSSRGMATSTLVDPTLLIDVPDHWSLEEAATTPVVYATSYYALIVRGQLTRGEKVLIHSGTGGIGIAAINIALSLNCEVFTTVGNDEKKKYLRALFPQVKEENIGCSRNISFESMIKRRTNGKGVDVVLNSLADDKFLASIRCVGKHGRFVEIGKYDLSLDRNIGLKMFLRNISFHGVFLDQLFERNEHNISRFNHVMALVKEGIKNGVVKPLDRTIFQRDEVEQAFRYMAKGIHVGKVILKIRDEEPDRKAIPKTLMQLAVPKTFFYPNKVYIIIGGLGGFGIEVTKWILDNGGKNIILTTRYGARTPYQHMCLMRWKRAGANVTVLTLNAAKRNEAEKLLQEGLKIGPLGGIFNSAVVLKDAFIDQQTPKSYEEVCAPKSIASKHLDELSRKLCPTLDYFVCFSSISCGRGNAGQTNYGYANSSMERICEQRRISGLHGLAIQWGIIGEVGVVHRHMGDDAMIAGVSAQSVKSCLESLDLFCTAKYPVVSSYVAAVLGKKTEQLDIVAKISKIIGISEDSIDTTANRSLGDMGIDSLIGVEIKQVIENNFDVSFSMQEILEMKISDLQALSQKHSQSSEASASKPSSLLVSTAEIKLPSMLKKEPLVELTKTKGSYPVFIVNIGDNDVSDFTLLAQKFNTWVCTLQWTNNINASNMQDLAKYYLDLIKQKVNTSFHLIGFSIGGSLAFEMALQNGDALTRSITLLDGSSNMIKNINKEADPKDLEISTLLSFVEQFSPDAAPKLEKELLKVKTFDQRTKIILKFLTASSTDSVKKDEISEAIKQYMKKMEIIRSYVPSRKLMNNLLLIEDSGRVLPNDVTEIKRTFSQVVSGQLHINRTFSADHLTNKDGVGNLYSALLEHMKLKYLI